VTARPRLSRGSHPRVRPVAGRHGPRPRQPFDLRLSGPAGGRWSRGTVEPIETDAVEFARALSGRAAGEGLLGRRVPS
jgi:hypothetical protein